MPQAKPIIAAPKEFIPVLQTATAGMAAKNAWTIRVVPSGQWQGMSQTGMRPDQGHLPHAYSDLKGGITYLSRDSVRSLSSDNLRRVLAHELGHMTLNTSDESKANKWADEFLNPKPKASIPSGTIPLSDLLKAK